MNIRFIWICEGNSLLFIVRVKSPVSEERHSSISIFRYPNRIFSSASVSRITLKIFPDETELQVTFDCSLRARRRLIRRKFPGARREGGNTRSRGNFPSRFRRQSCRITRPRIPSRQKQLLRAHPSTRSLSLSLSLSLSREVSFSYSVRALSTFFRRCTTSIIILEFDTLTHP